ncbi:hypothetical protein ACHAXS_001760 [Conticribra weissflogii]
MPNSLSSGLLLLSSVVAETSSSSSNSASPRGCRRVSDRCDDCDDIHKFTSKGPSPSSSLSLSMSSSQLSLSNLPLKKRLKLIHADDYERAPAQAAFCKERCKPDLPEIRFASATAFAAASSSLGASASRPSSSSFCTSGESGNDRHDDRHAKHGPSRKRNFSAYRFDCKDENGKDMGMGYFSSMGQSLQFPGGPSEDDTVTAVTVAPVVSRENLPDAVLVSNAPRPRRSHHPYGPRGHVQRRLSPWTDDGPTETRASTERIPSFREYQNSAFRMSRLTLAPSSSSRSSSAASIATDATTTTTTSTTITTSPHSRSLSRQTNNDKGNETWFAGDASVAPPPIATMHPIPTTLHALSNLKNPSDGRAPQNRNHRNQNDRDATSASSFFVRFGNRIPSKEGNENETETMPRLRNFVKGASSRQEANQEFVQAYIRAVQARNGSRWRKTTMTMRHG